MNDFPEDSEVYIGILDGELVEKVIPKRLARTVTAEDIARATDYYNPWRTGFRSGFVCAAILAGLIAALWWLP